MKFRKKPVVIEAVQWQGGNLPDVWKLGCGGEGSAVALAAGPDGSLIIPTLEGDHRCDLGDWIIRGVKGEFYPCKPDIFAATYEPAD